MAARNALGSQEDGPELKKRGRQLVNRENRSTEQIFTNPLHPLTEDYITGRFG